MFTVAALCFSGGIAGAATVYQTGFEQPTYSLGTVNNQDGWFAYPQKSRQRWFRTPSCIAAVRQ